MLAWIYVENLRLKTASRGRASAALSNADILQHLESKRQANLLCVFGAVCCVRDASRCGLLATCESTLACRHA